MCSQAEGDMGRQCSSPACAQGCSQWALRAAADLGTRTRTLRGQDTATVHQFWACFREGLHFNWEGEVSHSSEVCPYACLPWWGEKLWESELSREDTERSSRWWWSLTRHISPQGTAAWQQRQRPACGEQVFHANPEHFHSHEIPFRRKEPRIYSSW